MPRRALTFADEPNNLATDYRVIHYRVPSGYLISFLLRQYNRRGYSFRDANRSGRLPKGSSPAPGLRCG